MENIIIINGKVKYPITLDPGVWIFDDERIDLDIFFDETQSIEVDRLEEYTKNISKHWDREIMEGAIYPPTLKTEKKFEKEKILTGSFGMKLERFLKNANPLPDATSLQILTDDETVNIPIDQAYNLVLGFSSKGQPLKEDGPIHVYFSDRSNIETPLKKVRSLNVI